MDYVNNKTSLVVSSQVPEFVRRDHPLFVQFLQAYYQFLEQDDGLMYITKRFGDYYDIDTLYSDWLEDNLEDNTTNLVFQIGVPTEEKYHALDVEFFNNFAKFIPTTSAEP